MQTDDDVGKVAAASTHLVGTSLLCHRRPVVSDVPFVGHPVALTDVAHPSHSLVAPTPVHDHHKSLLITIAIALEEFLSEVVNGAATVAISRGSKNLAPAHIKAHVMMEPTLDFCRSVVQGAPDLTEEGADGDKPKAKKEQKPKAASAEKKKAPAKKKRKAESEEEEAWRTEDETDEEAAEDVAGADEEDVKVDLGDLADLDVDGLVAEDELEEKDGVAAGEEDDFDEF